MHKYLDAVAVLLRCSCMKDHISAALSYPRPLHRSMASLIRKQHSSSCSSSSPPSHNALSHSAIASAACAFAIVPIAAIGMTASWICHQSRTALRDSDSDSPARALVQQTTLP